MSHGYGFLTQSTIIPKKSKEIKINDNSGQVLLQSILQRQKERLKNKSKNQVPEIRAQKPKKNRGVQQRIKRDEQLDEKVKLTQKNYYKCLQKKAEVYAKAENKKANIDTLLVNFEQKQIANKQEQEQFQKAREQFYKGQIKNIESQQKSLHQNIEIQNASTTMMRERLAWAKQMLNQMNGVLNDDTKPKVIQSFDQKLSKEEREAFDKIINEEETKKIKFEAIRRRKQEKEQQKLRKLRKLNIIKDVSEASELQKKPKEQEQNEPVQHK